MLKYLGSAWARLEDWLNVPIYRWFRNIDLILVMGFIICVVWYYYTSDWQGAIIGGLMYILMAMVSLWLL